MFSAMAELNLLKEEMLYREQMRSPDHHFGVDGGATVVGAVAVLQGSYKPGEIALLINPDQQMGGIDKIPQAAGGELEQGGVSPVPV